jgi:hypothetical protein
MRMKIKMLILALLGSGLGSVVNAQQLNLKKGDKYTVVTFMNTNMGAIRGDKQIDFQYRSSVTKSYTVTAASDQGYQLNITTENVTDTIDAFNQKLAFDSKRATDPNSEIETALSKMVGQTQTLSLDRDGRITKVGNKDMAVADENLSLENGIYAKSLKDGNTLNFGPDFKLPVAAKVGTQWTVATNEGDLVKNTKYTITEIAANFTKVTFTSKQTMPGMITNSNGAMLIDNTTGIVLQRIIKFHNVSNEVNGDDKNYQVARKGIINEICVKLK